MQPHHRLLTAGLLLGMGMGGFLDGIVFHQILQLHNMLSAELPPTNLPNMKINMAWDGLFHAGTWLLTLLGIGALWSSGKHRATPWTARYFGGTLLAGWGVFNLAEGVIDHHILHIHHVVEELGLSHFDYAFAGSGLFLIGIGWILTRRPA